MSRMQRTKSISGCYHIMLRGNEKKNIFLDDEDKTRFIETAYRMKQRQRFFLHAFCLMDNHIHLMLSEGNEDIAKVMKRITVSYVFYFNKKYKRVGHLFQDRFKSEAVSDDGYVLSLARYIHQNPVKAGIVREPGEYKWSSYNGYLNDKNILAEGLDTELILGMLPEDKETAVKQFSQYMNKESEDLFLDMHEVIDEIDEDEARRIYKQMLVDRDIKVDEQKAVSDNLLIEFREKTNLTLRRMAIVTGINKDKLSRLFRKTIH